MNASLLRRSIVENLSNDSTGAPTLTMSQVSHRLARLKALNFGSEKKPSWENPEASIGDLCRTMGRNQCWHAQGPARELFIRLAAEVKTYLDRNCEPPSRELHWSLYMIGPNKSTARPVLMFICEDSPSRKTARKTIKESGILLRYPGVDTADCSYPPDFGQLVQLASRHHRNNLVDLEDLGLCPDPDTDDSPYSSNFRQPGFGQRGNHSGRGVSEYLAANTAGSPDLPDSAQLTQFASGGYTGDLVKMMPRYPGMDREYFRRPVFGQRRTHLEMGFSGYPVGYPYPPDSAQLTQFASGGHTDDLAIKHENSEASVFYYPTNSILGSHIFVKDSNGINLTSRKATAGAVFNFGNKTCFLTAAHGFESRRTPSDPCPAFECDIDGEGDSDDEKFIATSRQGTRSPLPRRPDWSLEESEFPVARSKIRGSFQQPISGHSSHQRHKASARSEDPLESGTLLASSVEGPRPGLDYALIEIEASHIRTPNQIILDYGSQYPTLDPTRVSDSGPKDAEIVAITGSSGYLKGGYLRGRLLGAPSFSRAPGQEAHIPSQEVWTVKFDGKLEEGDCGTCVFDAQTGDLYGHIVSGNPDSGYAYIIPAYQIRDDLLRRFGKELQLHRPESDAWPKQFSTPSEPWGPQTSRRDSPGD